VVYKELSYVIIGILFEVYNELGYGHPEKYYYRAISKAFTMRKIDFKLCFKGEAIGRYYVDYIIENKIVLEMKKGNFFSKRNIEQIKGYIKATNMKLAILVNFTSNGVKFFRLLNINNL